MIGGGGQPKPKISNINVWWFFGLDYLPTCRKTLNFQLNLSPSSWPSTLRVCLRFSIFFGTMILKSLINKLHPFGMKCTTALLFQPIFRAKYLGMQPLLVWHRGGLACRTSFRRRARRCTKEVKMTESDGSETGETLQEGKLRDR